MQPSNVRLLQLFATLLVAIAAVIATEELSQNAVKRASWMDVKRNGMYGDGGDLEEDKKASWMDVKKKASWMDVKKKASWMDVKKRASWMDVKKRASWMDVKRSAAEKVNEIYLNRLAELMQNGANA